MAFADYLDLRTAVMEQIGTSEMADVFDRLTKLAETRLTRDLRMAQQVNEVTVTAVNGEVTVPDDFAEMIGLYNECGREINQQTLQALQSATNPTGDGTYTLQYYANIPTLTESMTTTNWLLEGYPDVYLYAVAYEAARHLRDADAAQAMMALREEAVMDARASDHRARYSRARVRVKGVTP